MQITSIELAGTSDHKLRNGQPGFPRAFAKISRKRGDEYITVELIVRGGDRKHHVLADDADDQYSMAEILQESLDGCVGTKSMIEDYYRVIRWMAD